MELRVLDAIAANQKQTRFDVAKALCPDRQHVVLYAFDNLRDRGLIEAFTPEASPRQRYGRKSLRYRLTEFGDSEIDRAVNGLDAALDALFRSDTARQLVAALKNSGAR